MRALPSIAFLCLLGVPLIALSQGSFQYDQQSQNHSIPPSVLYDIQPSGPIGQSFTPTLPSVGFVQLDLFDGHPNNGVGATLYVNLRSNSITGPILTSISSVFLPDTPSGGGVTNFIFSGPAAVVPGTMYFFEIVVQCGDTWRANSVGDLYSSGTLYLQGAAQPLDDLWFREAAIVPEPSAAWLILLAGGVCFYVRPKSVRTHVIANPPSNRDDQSPTLVERVGVRAFLSTAYLRP